MDSRGGARLLWDILITHGCSQDCPIYLESRVEPVTGQLELAIEKAAIWIEKPHRKERVGPGV